MMRAFLEAVLVEQLMLVMMKGGNGPGYVTWSTHLMASARWGLDMRISLFCLHPRDGFVQRRELSTAPIENVIFSKLEKKQ